MGTCSFPVPGEAGTVTAPLLGTVFLVFLLLLADTEKLSKNTELIQLREVRNFCLLTQCLEEYLANSKRSVSIC